MPEGFVGIPSFTLKVQGGGGRIAWEIEQETEPKAYSISFLRKKGIKPENAKRASVVGDSMESTLYDGDSVLFDEGDTEIKDGKVYVLRYGDGFRIKRLSKRFDGALILTSDNAKYADEVIPEEQAAQFIQVLGRVKDRSGSGGL